MGENHTYTGRFSRGNFIIGGKWQRLENSRCVRGRSESLASNNFESWEYKNGNDNQDHNKSWQLRQGILVKKKKNRL